MDCLPCFDTKEEGHQLNRKISGSHEQPMQPPHVEKLPSGKFCFFKLLYLFFLPFVGFVISYLGLFSLGLSCDLVMSNIYTED
jgi:hypothetical protein